MKTYRQIRQSLTEVGADREEDQNFKLGPDKMSPTPSDEDEYDELDDDIEDTHQEVEAIRPVYVRDKLGHYTTASAWSSSGTMAQMTQQAATKNLQSEYVPEDGEVLDEEETINEISKPTLARYTKRAAHDLDIKSKDHGYKTGLRKAGRGPKEPSPLGGMKPAGPDDHERKLSRTRRNRRVGIGRAVNRLAKEEYALEENAMDSLKKIVSRQTAETIRLADGSRLQVDMTTANALLGVHGALNIHNQKKMADTLNSNKAGFAKMAKFAFNQFGSRPGKVGTPNTGVREANEVIFTKAERKAAADRARAARFKRDVARMTKDHRKVDPAPPQKPNSAQRAGRKEEYVREDDGLSDRLRRHYSGGNDESDAKRKLIANRQRIADQKKAREDAIKKKAAEQGQRIGEGSDEKEYDNYPWTKGDLSPKQVRAKLELAKKIAKERARKRKGGGTSDVEYDEKIGETASSTQERPQPKLIRSPEPPKKPSWAKGGSKKPGTGPKPKWTQEEWDALSESEKGDILFRQKIASRVARNRALKNQKRELSRGKRKSGKTSDKVYDYMIDKEEGKDQRIEKNSPRKHQHS